MKELLQYIMKYIVGEQSSYNTTSKGDGINVWNPNPFVLAELRAACAAQGLDCTHFTDTNCVWVGPKGEPPTQDKLLSALSKGAKS